MIVMVVLVYCNGFCRGLLMMVVFVMAVAVILFWGFYLWWVVALIVVVVNMSGDGLMVVAVANVVGLF